MSTRSAASGGSSRSSLRSAYNPANPPPTATTCARCALIPQLCALDAVVRQGWRQGPEARTSTTDATDEHAGTDRAGRTDRSSGEPTMIPSTGSTSNEDPAAPSTALDSPLV